MAGQGTGVRLWGGGGAFLAHFARRPEPVLDPEEERRQFMERFGGASGIGSSDVYGGGDANQDGLARKMASTGLNGAKAIGGWAASSASSWLRGQNKD